MNENPAFHHLPQPARQPKFGPVAYALSLLGLAVLPLVPELYFRIPC